MADDVLVRIRTALDRGGIQGARRGVPAVNMVPPVPSDYFAGTTPSSAGADLATSRNATATTSVAVQFFGETSVSTVFNGSGDTVYLNKYQLRGQHLPEDQKAGLIFLHGRRPVEEYAKAEAK
jgi:hypothetical protein